MKDKIINLICCCCNANIRGRQWWNRDKGYGLCSSCAEWIAETETAKEMRSNYGVRGKHYDIKQEGA